MRCTPVAGHIERALGAPEPPLERVAEDVPQPEPSATAAFEPTADASSAVDLTGTSSPLPPEEEVFGSVASESEESAVMPDDGSNKGDDTVGGGAVDADADADSERDDAAAEADAAVDMQLETQTPASVQTLSR